MEENNQETLSQKLDRLVDVLETNGKKKKKNERPFRMPWSGKVSNGKLKQGYVTIIEISENNALSFKKEQIVDSTIKLGDTYHAIGDGDAMTYKGKPALIIPKKSNVPYNPNTEVNNTYAQKHIMSRMMNEVIGTAKKLSMAGISIGAVILIGVVVYAFVSG